jgi:Cu+-exporting ATPase
LAQADVGIAMGTGPDVAMMSAEVTLVKGDLSGIVRARVLSRATMLNIKQNLFFAYNSLEYRSRPVCCIPSSASC